MILSYSKDNIEKQDFKRKIISGEKIHSVRLDKYRKWKPGSIIHHVENNRTKLQSCFYTGICEAVQEVDIYFYRSNISSIIVYQYDDLRIWVPADIFSANDGFYSLEAFNSFFYSICKKLKSDILSMRIIHFTKFIY